MGKTIKISNFSNLLKVLKQLNSKYNTFCPALEDGVENYKPLTQMKDEEAKMIEEIVFGNKPPLGSIKSFLFPDSEIYIKFAKKGGKLETEEVRTAAPQLILGVKPCDAKSVGLIDKVFLEKPEDTLYKDKREQTLIVSTVCSKPGPNCSCEEFCIDSLISPLADIMMTKGGSNQEEIILRAQSEKGEGFLQLLLEVEGFTAKEVQEMDLRKNTNPTLSPEKIQKLMDELFEAPLWENLAMLCIGCGTCTYYCPTCHCYDIRDFNRKDQGVRYRTWDSCMFSNFTNMAGNHNPRPTKTDRLKNRFFHKLNYFVKKQGDLACVGCGRCAQLCPAGISINTILNKIGGDIYES
jgi:ferredoxin